MCPDESSPCSLNSGILRFSPDAGLGSGREEPPSTALLRPYARRCRHAPDQSKLTGNDCRQEALHEPSNHRHLDRTIHPPTHTDSSPPCMSTESHVVSSYSISTRYLGTLPLQSSTTRNGTSFDELNEIEDVPLY
jgi:hypothetical protein